MTFFIRSLLTILLIVICATHSVDARTRHRTTKWTEPTVATNGAQATVETKRYPAELSQIARSKAFAGG